MLIKIELTSFLAKNKQSASLEFSKGTVAEALIAFGIDLDEVGFVTADDVLCKKESQAVEGTTYKVYPTIIAG
ncbi:MAG: hypothetical protein WBL80_08965 [Erysipelotrichaceae bacterium]